jgi:hypothetical protein
MPFMRKFCATQRGARSYSMPMNKLEASQVTRTLTIVLPEADWQALRSVEPDAISWLQDRIRERLSGSPGSGGGFDRTPRASGESYWGGDEY